MTFSVDEDSIDPAVFGLTSYASPISPAPRIDRRSAIQVPAVKRTRDLVAGALGGLPVDLYSPTREQVRSALFEQPEKDTPRSVTMTRTFEDMLFEGVAWWRVTEFGWHGYPVKVRRLEPRSVNVENNGRVYLRADGSTQGMANEWIPDAELIRFDSPNDGLLIAGARAIRTCLALETAAQRYADEPLPLGYFSPTDGADPAEDDDVIDLLNSWRDARQSRATGYVPAALKYNAVQFTPEQLQMSEARQHAVLEIARLAGVDPEELGVSTTSRTYANQFDRRKAFIDFTLGGYLNAIQDRLSMGDVTPTGYYARINLSAFLRSDDKTRYETYAIGMQVGAIDQAEVRSLEDKPPLGNHQEAPVENAVEVIETFETTEVTVLDAMPSAQFTVDRESRTITGLAVPFNVPAMSKGRMFQFSKGSLRFADVSRVKLLVQHDFGAAVGYATALEETDEGLVASFKVARGEDGDKALTLAEDKVLDGLSIGLGQGGKFSTKAGVFHAVDAPLAEISLTPCPAFDDARVISVAASADQGDAMDDQTQIVEAPDAPDFSVITDAISKGFENLAMPHRETVPAGGALQVTEELPYRFNGEPGAHGFINDLRAGFTQGDSEAKNRLETFLGECFAVSTGNASALAPTQNRPELYVPQLQYTRPLWEMVTNGVITDRVPFTVPKFSSASGLVAAHVEGTEPTPGAFAATSQTVTPGAVSGKIEINREVWDQGGSPQADGIVWGEMLNAYYEAIEAKIATLLNGLALSEINLASAVNSALLDAVTGVVVDTQYARGGNRFTSFAADGGLFKALVNAADTAGRKLLPVVGPQNAQGEASPSFDRVMLGNLPVRAAWALNTGVANSWNSYLFVPSSVYAWASAPKRFTFEYQVKSVDMAIWGYSATACLRDSDVKRIDYTTADA